MNSNLFRSLGAALMCSLVIAGAYLSIPLTPPVVLANFFAILSGLLLGPLWGGLAILAYLLMGVLGLPVFSGGAAGLPHLLGSTGGFLLGYLVGAVLAGFIAGTPRSKGRPSLVRLALGALAALVCLYLLGLPWLSMVMTDLHPEKPLSLIAALTIMLPYLLGDLVKMAAAVLVARTVIPQLHALGLYQSVSRKTDARQG